VDDGEALVAVAVVEPDAGIEALVDVDDVVEDDAKPNL
jgi:hypothetical protein